MKKFFGVLLSVVMILLLLGGCGGKTNSTEASGETSATKEQADTGAAARKANNEIVVGIAQDLSSSLDPYELSTAGTRELMFNVYEALYKVAPSGDYEPALATAYTVSDDGLTYRFTLREGVKFHNDAVLTAADVVYSFNTCREKSVDKNVKAALQNVAEVKADGNTVTMTLTAPNSDFLVYVGSVYIVPDSYSDQATKPVGTGPFVFTERKVQDSIVFTRFENYWGEKAKIQKVTFRIFDTETALVTALDSDTVDLFAHLTSTQVNGLSKNYEVLEGTMNLVQALYINNAVKPFDDVRVRQALNYAIDVDAMLQMTADGHGTKLGSSIYPAFTKYFDESLVNAYPHDAAKAKELLTQAGYPNGFDMTITVPSNYTNHVDTAVVLAEQLKEAGINATVQEVEWDAWVTDIYQGRNFQTTVVGFDASTLTAEALLARFVSDSSKNMCNYQNTEFDALMAEAGSITDDARRTECYRAAEKLLSDDAANVYLQDMADFVALRSTLSGFRFYPLYVLDLSGLTY